MPRKPQVRSKHLPYHVTNRSNNREWFSLPIEEVWAIFSPILLTAIVRYEVNLMAFVLMDNHFHLIVQTPRANLGRFMNYVTREVSRAIGRRTGRINHVFGGRYKSCLLRDPQSVAHAYKYVYRNPVDAGLSKTCEDYPFSTLNRLLGNHSPFPVADSLVCGMGLIPTNVPARLRWLNEPFPEEQRDMIRRALRRREFAFTTRGVEQPVVRRLEAAFQKEAGTFDAGGSLGAVQKEAGTCG